jgi:hypothetical protein
VWGPADEAFGVFGVGIEEDHTSLSSDRFGPAVVDVGGCVQADARVAVVVVIPAEEPGTVGTSVLEAAESVGEVRSILEGPELRF